MEYWREVWRNVTPEAYVVGAAIQAVIGVTCIIFTGFGIFSGLVALTVWLIP